ncbi:hypothetical protein N1851_026725 [Merluccius polli]|uniref:Uncharacterized protein n=1 Tax=Merluccius polli TaxID=89951 RepID=A0AA47MBG5_MERPO|nr:hypothetical protein N1851_026725 [Merluccius polli]
MEEELQELRDLVAQLKVDNERLRQEQAPVGPAPSATLSTSSVVPNASAPAAERLVFVPRDRKCPMFRGRSGIALVEWVEEVQACVRARHLSLADQAFFLFDHLEGEAREEIKYRPSVERGDPARIIAILQELYGCSESYVALQEAFFSRKQHEGETLLEFSLALMSLMERVPGVMGMNVIRKCYQELFVQHGLALFELSSVTQAPQPVTQALQKCHQVTTQTPPDLMGKVKVRETASVSILPAIQAVAETQTTPQVPPHSTDLVPAEPGPSRPSVIAPAQPSTSLAIPSTSSSDTSVMAPRRSARANAGQHSNVHRIPRPLQFRALCGPLYLSTTFLLLNPLPPAPCCHIPTIQLACSSSTDIRTSSWTMTLLSFPVALS